jgi:hypothetical protein
MLIFLSLYFSLRSWRSILRIIVENGTQIVLAPVNNLEPGKVYLPQPICSIGRGELVLILYNFVYRADYQVMAVSILYTLDSDI